MSEKLVEALGLVLSALITLVVIAFATIKVAAVVWAFLASVPALAWLFVVAGLCVAYDVYRKLVRRRPQHS